VALLQFSGEPLLHPDGVVQNVYGSTESALFIGQCAGPRGAPPSAFHALWDFNAGRVDAERFTPCADHPTERLYATGDFVGRLPDGHLVHLGRSGRLVKIRGRRVLLAEVEQHLQAMPGVNATAVVERPEREGAVLYGFVCRDGATGPQPAQHGGQALPEPQPRVRRQLGLVQDVAGAAVAAAWARMR
jgi:acyl-CoA synthetase (AMP-forming)/AMP-acid ligase II